MTTWEEREAERKRKFEERMLLNHRNTMRRASDLIVQIQQGKATPEQVQTFMMRVEDEMTGDSKNGLFKNWRLNELQKRWGGDLFYLASFLFRANETLETAAKIVGENMRNPLNNRVGFGESVYPKLLELLNQGEPEKRRDESEDDFADRRASYIFNFGSDGLFRKCIVYIGCWVNRAWGVFGPSKREYPNIDNLVLELPAGVDINIEIIHNPELQDKIVDYQQQIESQDFARRNHRQKADAQMSNEAAYLRNEVGDNDLAKLNARTKIDELNNAEEPDDDEIDRATAERRRAIARGKDLSLQLENLERRFAGEIIEGVTFDQRINDAVAFRIQELNAAETAEGQVAHFTQLLAQARQELAEQENAQRTAGEQTLLGPELSSLPIDLAQDPVPIPAKTRLQLETDIAQTTADFKKISAEIEALMRADDRDFLQIGMKSGEATTLKTLLAKLQAELEALPTEVSNDPVPKIVLDQGQGFVDTAPPLDDSDDQEQEEPVLPIRSDTIDMEYTDLSTHQNGTGEIVSSQEALDACSQVVPLRHADIYAKSFRAACLAYERNEPETAPHLPTLKTVGENGDRKGMQRLEKTFNAIA